MPGDDERTLGGVVEVLAYGVSVGLGSHTQWDRRLDGRLAQAIMSIQAFKGVEIGAGFAAVAQKGTQHRDEATRAGFLSNHAGGVLGGISTATSNATSCPTPTSAPLALSTTVGCIPNLSAAVLGTSTCAAAPPPATAAGTV